MTHYIVKVNDHYMTPRRSTGDLHVNRSAWTDEISKARVFTNTGAARNSAKKSIGSEHWHRIEILPVELTFTDETGE